MLTDGMIVCSFNNLLQHGFIHPVDDTTVMADADPFRWYKPGVGVCRSGAAMTIIATGNRNLRGGCRMGLPGASAFRMV
ncbi:hypothetical protein [Paracoccus sp. Ld10]|uniref:hypothetical protein n=1 Tax=Paracoccus sp. Ld10 TaxID=649158 RepID=UPI0038666F94